MASDLLNILDPRSDEFKESFVVFQQYYPEIKPVFFFKSIFLPIKFLGNKRPALNKCDVVLDCINAEKYKRMKKYIPGGTEALIYVSDLSTDRSRKFCSELDSKLKKIFEKIHDSRYWGLALTLLFKTISESASLHHFFSLFTFRARAIQELVQYDWLMKTTGAAVLITANEDSWISPLLAKYCRLNHIRSVNVMHGRLYQTRQFYDESIVFGRTCEAATRKLASSNTKVILGSMDEIAENKVADHFEYHKKIILFDQPVFEFYTPEMKTALYAMLENLAKNHGYTVQVKPHPAQTNQLELKQHSFELIQNGINRELLRECGIAIGICSTVGMEVISSGVPMIYFNHERVLDHFLQIKFLSDTSPKTAIELESLIINLQNRDFYGHFQKKQFELLNAEYGVN